MRKLTVICMMLVLFLCLCVPALADFMSDTLLQLQNAPDFDTQLQILDSMADANAAALEDGCWETSLTVPAAMGAPKGIPVYWGSGRFTEAEHFPEELRGRKFIAIWTDHHYANGLLAGDLLARFPEEMRAASLAEAEYALVISCAETDSGYTYNTSITSYHLDYSAYVYDLKTGSAFRFWKKRSPAKTIGKIGSDMNGTPLTSRQVWVELRPSICGELSVAQENGAVLLFDLDGTDCFVKGYEGELTIVEVPAEVMGHPVTRIGEEAFRGCKTLQAVVLPEGLSVIGDNAFKDCSSLSQISFPSTLRHIESYCFCGTALKSVELPEGLESLGFYAFADIPTLEFASIPGTVTEFGQGLFDNCKRLIRVIAAEGLANFGHSYTKNASFYRTDNLMCVFLPASVSQYLDEAAIGKRTTVYAPEGSYALAWASQNGLKAVACEAPAFMPVPEFVTEGDFEYLLFDGESSLYAYSGNEKDVVVPDAVRGCPVTAVLADAFNLDATESITLPQSVLLIQKYGICAPDANRTLHIYLPNPEIELESFAITRSGMCETPIVLHAPEGSSVKRYVKNDKYQPLQFEAWE